jgi:TDG/mug DNA glycosylase family protein
MTIKHHRVYENWMGKSVETLEDLLRPGLRAICIGINPAPTSVTRGHYYQGRLGQLFYERLRRAGILPDARGWEDDLAFEGGLGFTDIVKRPTARASEVRTEEFAHGREALRTKIDAVSPKLLIFTFKKAAVALCGPFGGNGLLAGRTFGGATMFVMPGPYAPRAEVTQRLRELGKLF